MKIVLGMLWATVAVTATSAFAAGESQPVRAWTRPSWGFVSPQAQDKGAKQFDSFGAQQLETLRSSDDSQKNSLESYVTPALIQSLMFDQKSDKASYRPVPVALIQASEPRQVASADDREAQRVVQAVAAKPAATVVTINEKMNWDHESSRVDPLNKVLSNMPSWNALIERLVAQQTKSKSSPTLSFPKLPATKHSIVAPAKSLAQAEEKPAVVAAVTPAIVPVVTPVVVAPKSVAKIAVVPPAPAQPAVVPTPVKIHPSQKAVLVVLDDEAMNMGEVKFIKGAEIHWFGYSSDLTDKVNDKGEGFSPFKNFVSARFVITADGYVPAVGYVVEGVRTVVSMVSEQRLPSVIKSLGVIPDPDHVMVFGKALSAKNTPVADLSLDATVRDPFKIFYSLGNFGVFHPKAEKTGSAGDFFISGVSRALQYLMPSELVVNSTTKNSELKDWPASIVDFAGLGPVVSHTIQKSNATTYRTDVQDAFTFEKPEGSAVTGTVGGQRGVIVPDESGRVVIKDLYARPSVDLIELKADRYLTTWLSASVASGHLPDAIQLFNSQQLSEIFSEAPDALDRNRGMVFGNLDPEHYRAPITVRVINADGKADAKAKVLYFNAQNRISLRQDRTHSSNQNFSVVGLDPGEYELIISDAETGTPVAAQVVRAAYETISQVKF